MTQLQTTKKQIRRLAEEWTAILNAATSGEVAEHEAKAIDLIRRSKRKRRISKKRVAVEHVQIHASQIKGLEEFIRKIIADAARDNTLRLR